MLGHGITKMNIIVNFLKKSWHPSKVLYTFLEHFSFAGAFSQKTVKYFWAHMKDAKLTSCFFISILLILTLIVSSPGLAHGDFRIVIMQDQKGMAEKYRPLLNFLKEKDFDTSFVAARNYPHAAELFVSGLADGMFSGSAIAGCMLIKQLAYPVVRPVNIEGWSSYWAVVIGHEGSKRFTQSASYFDNKRIIFSSLASSGEFYFHSLDDSLQTHATLLKACSHGAALDALSRQAADFAIVKNRVWDKARLKYPGLIRVGEDPGGNPDGTLIVSKKTDKTVVEKLRNVLLDLKEDQSSFALSAKKRLEIKAFIPTSIADFKYTIQLLKKAGVDQNFNFNFE